MGVSAGCMDSALRVSLLALAFCPRASGWVLFPADTLASNDVKVNSINDLLSKGNIGGLPPIFRWSAVRDLRDEDGLGGGITFAFDPSFCEDMILKFEEAQGAIKFYDFVTCDTIKDVVSSAFATWEGNNRNVYFTDVSNICESEDLWEDLKSDECTSTRCRTCPLAEVVINIFKSTPEDHSGARVQPKAVTASPLATNMQRAEGGSLRYVELQFGDNLCWYVDATFCSLFHNMEANGLPVVAIVGIILGAAFLIAAMVCAFMVYRLLKVFVYTLFASWDTDNDGQVELEEIEEAARAVFKSLKTLVKTGSPSGMGGRTIEVDDALFAVLDVFANQLNLIHLMIALFFLIFPALVLNDIFLPCWNCYDFEAAAVHEIGHILGFDHPDQYPEYNFVSDRSRYNCSEPTRGVSKDDAYDANSVMQAFLPRNPKTCLTPDDLDGLNFLYPVCSDVINESPVCVKVRARQGRAQAAWACARPHAPRERPPLTGARPLLPPLHASRASPRTRTLRALRHLTGSPNATLAGRGCSSPSSPPSSSPFSSSSLSSLWQRRSWGHASSTRSAWSRRSR